MSNLYKKYKKRTTLKRVIPPLPLLKHKGDTRKTIFYCIHFCIKNFSQQIYQMKIYTIHIIFILKFMYI